VKRESPDAAATAILALLPETIDYLNAGAPEYRPPRWVTEFQNSPREISIRGKEGADLLDGWRRQTEAEMEAILRREEWGLLRVLGMLRRLPADHFFLGERPAEGAPRHFDPYLANVAEYAALRYAARDARGTRLEAWTKGPSGFGRDIPEVDRGGLAQVMALTRLTGPQFGHLDNVRKTLARGGEATQRPDGYMDARQDPGLAQRFDLYDRRRARFSSYGSTAGAFRSPGDDDDPLGSLHHFQRATWREDEGRDPWRYERLGRWIPKSEKRFVISKDSLRPLYEHLHLLEDVVIDRYGLAPEVIVAALMSLERCLWFFLCAGFDYENLEADRLVFLDRTGCLLVGEGIMDTAVLGQIAHEAHKHAFPDAPRDADASRFAHGFKRLAYLDSYRLEDISLEDGHPWVRGTGDAQPTPMPRPFVYPAGPSARLVDLHALGEFARGLYDCLSPLQKAGQRVSKDFELRLDEYLGEGTGRPRAFPSGTELRRRMPGGGKESVAELDASFGVGSVLVAVDAKSIPISLGHRRYQYGALRTRWEKFAGDGKRKGYVQKADGQAEKLARHPRGINYDLSAAGYTHVVTLLCSAVPEFVDTDDPGFYVREDLPRIATPQELRAFLTETDEAELRSLPFARRLDVGRVPAT
jgi:hypothetical protein